MFYLKLFSVFIVCFILSCGGDTTDQTKENNPGTASLKGRDYLCFKDAKKENAYYVAASTEKEGRFIYIDTPYKTRTECEKEGIERLLKDL